MDQALELVDLMGVDAVDDALGLRRWRAGSAPVTWP